MAQNATYMAGYQYSPADMMQRDTDFMNPGVISLSDLIVTPGSGLNVNVSGAAQGSVGGNACLPGGYRFYNDSSAGLALSTANATNPRIDLIVAGIDTTQSPYVATLKIITGTPASSPVVPSIPATLQAIPLAQVLVGANVTSIVAGNITDVRDIAGIKGDASNLTNLNNQPDFAAHLTDNVNSFALKVDKTTTVNGHALSSNVAVTTTDLVLQNVSNTSDINKPVSTAQQTALNLKANLVSPVFTGIPTAPTPTTSDNSIDIATTAFVKAQSYITSGGAPVQSVSGRTGVVVLTSTDVGLANVSNTNDANKPISTAETAALALKANSAYPEFTGIAQVFGNTSYTTSQLHNILLSTGPAVLDSMGLGDLWIMYV